MNALKSIRSELWILVSSFGLSSLLIWKLAKYFIYNSQELARLIKALEQQKNSREELSLNQEHSLVSPSKVEQIPHGPKLIYKICVSGGPNAGKTSGIVYLAKQLREHGFDVFVVPESATLISQGGGVLDFSQHEEQDAIDLQITIMKNQISLEETFITLAQLSTKPCVILCDRGLMDGSAYIPANQWFQVLKKQNTNEIAIRDCRYDLVVHMVTAADGASQFYQNKTQESSEKQIKEAIILDKKLRNAWLGHPEFEIIDNYSVSNYDEKLTKLLSVVLKKLGIKKASEGPAKQVKRKYLLDTQNNLYPTIPKEIKIQKFVIEETYLKMKKIQDKSQSIKIVRRGDQNQFVYTWLMKEYDGVNCFRQRKIIEYKEYLLLLQNSDSNRKSIIKERRCFIWKENFFAIDTFLNVQEGFSILKSVNEADEENLPQFFVVKREVTQEKGYQNKNISKINWYVPEGDEEIVQIRKPSVA